MLRLSFCVAMIALAGLGHASDAMRCHDAAMNRARMSNADISRVLHLLGRGNDHLNSLRQAGDGQGVVSGLRNACPFYCEAGGALATIITDDRTQALYGGMYWSLIDLSMNCDSALLHAEAGAWDSVPFYLNEMHRAALEFQAKAP